MAFGIALSVKSRVRECTPALLRQVLDSEQTARVCAEIADALEQVKRGEMAREDFETFKSERKRQLAILTPHATFPQGRRCNGEAVPSGLS
ncbi:MAG: VirE protein, partial [Prevotella sp.]|nr:VirE protein [Prevotella sp.]